MNLNKKNKISVILLTTWMSVLVIGAFGCVHQSVVSDGSQKNLTGIFFKGNFFKAFESMQTIIKSDAKFEIDYKDDLNGKLVTKFRANGFGTKIRLNVSIRRIDNENNYLSLYCETKVYDESTQTYTTIESDGLLENEIIQIFKRNDL